MNTTHPFWRLAAWSLVPLILSIPLIAMQVTDEVKWDAADFVFMGTLLIGAGVAFELVARVSRSTGYRIAVGIALATGVLLVWMNAAVGLVGSENDDFNRLYGGVLAVGAIGALLARFQPKRMAIALAATAIAQAAIAVVALMLDKHHGTLRGAAEILGVNGIFVALFLASALLFGSKRAARA